MSEVRAASGGASTPLDFLDTGVPNLDRILGGGVLRGAIMMVVGPPGAGKTMLAQQIAFHRARQGEAVLYLTGHSETHDKFVAHNRGLGFFDPAFVGGLIQFGSLPDLLEQGAADTEKAVVRTARQHEARLVVLDSFRSVRRLLGGHQAGQAADADAAQFLYGLGAQLALLGATMLVLVEGDPDESAHMPELTVGDVVLALGRELHGTRQRRLLDMRKVRGAAPLDGLHSYELGMDGFVLWPRFESLVAPMEPPWSDERAGFGVGMIDDLLHGGLTRGTNTVAAGSPGTGKTLLGLHFLAAGARLGEPGLLVGFMESATQLREKARVFGLDVTDAGANVRMVALPGYDLEADRIAGLLYEEVEQRGIRRLMIDSAGYLQRAMPDPSRATDFFAAVTVYLRGRGVTTYLPLEIARIAGSGLEFGDTPMSVLAENLLLLRHVEYLGRLHRVVSVLQMRFSDFDAAIREFGIEAGRGFVARKDLPVANGVLTGVRQFTVATEDNPRA